MKLLFISKKIWYVNYTYVCAVYCDWKTLSIDKVISPFSQIIFHQIHLDYFINMEITCLYFFFSLEVYVDILSLRKSLVAAHTWIVIYALFDYHIGFCIQHVLRFVNSAGVHVVVTNYTFFSAHLHRCQIYLIYIIYFSVGLLKFEIYFAEAVFSHYDVV